MANLTVTATKVAPIFPLMAEIVPITLGETATAGQVLYKRSDGKYGIAGAAAAGKQQARGILLDTDGRGGALLKKGHVAGFTISQAYDAQLFLSDTLGALADAAGTKSVPCARVVAMSDDPNLTKVVYVEFDWITQF